MSSIANALQQLDSMVSELEGSVTVIEQTVSGCQRDMFGAEVSNENTTTPVVSREAVAQKIDTAIEKVEELLEEA